MKIMWETPYTHVEGFAANEYCASVCFRLACQNDEGYSWDAPSGYNPSVLWAGYWGNDNYSIQSGYYDGSPIHDRDCAVADNNYVRIETDENGKESFAFLQMDSEQKWLHGEVTYQEDTNNDQSFGTDDLFAWVTFANNDNRIWLHWAKAVAGIQSAPKRNS